MTGRKRTARIVAAASSAIMAAAIAPGACARPFQASDTVKCPSGNCLLKFGPIPADKTLRLQNFGCLAANKPPQSANPSSMSIFLETNWRGRKITQPVAAGPASQRMRNGEAYAWNRSVTFYVDGGRALYINIVQATAPGVRTVFCTITGELSDAQ